LEILVEMRSRGFYDDGKSRLLGLERHALGRVVWGGVC
jgi:hypothetical protein